MQIPLRLGATFASLSTTTFLKCKHIKLSEIAYGSERKNTPPSQRVLKGYSLLSSDKANHFGVQQRCWISVTGGEKSYGISFHKITQIFSRQTHRLETIQPLLFYICTLYFQWNYVEHKCATSFSKIMLAASLTCFPSSTRFQSQSRRIVLTLVSRNRRDR